MSRRQTMELVNFPAISPRCQEFWTRVAGLLFVYFLALLLWALIEREIRRRMEKEEIDQLLLYPELRKSEAPSTDGIFPALHGLRRHRLLDKDGNVLRAFFFDTLSPVAAQALKLLGVSCTSTEDVDNPRPAR